MSAPPAVLPHRSAIVQNQLVVRYFIENRHSFSTDEAQTACLDRIDPTCPYLRKAPGFEPHYNRHHIGNPAMQERRSVCFYGGGLFVEKVQDHGDVVWRQAPQRILFASDDTQVQPLARSVEKISHCAIADLLL